MGDDPALLSQRDINILNQYFPDFELPLHMGINCDVSINGKVTSSAMIAVSPHLISAFKAKGTQKISLLKTFYITDILHLYHLPDSVRVKLEKDNLQVEIYNSRDAALMFTQILYRNYTLIYYKLGPKYELEVSTKEPEKFPDIKLDISPSQRFQFYFSAQCAKCQVNYRHDVCRYMHNLITTNNPIFDFSQIPINSLTGKSSVLTPLIKTLQITKYIRGICWENYSYPDLLNQLSPLFGNEEKTEGLRMIHLVNCDLSGDFSKIIKYVDNSTERRACFISYWNLSNNPKLNFENFSHMIDLTLSKIKFFSISNCNIDEKIAKEIFLALSNNPNSFEIKHLEIGGVSMVGKSIVAFEKFLKILNSRHTNKINLLDISSCDNLTAVLELISKELPNLEIFNVSHNKFTGDDFLLLTNYISHSKMLKEIDLSRSKISSENVAEIIKTFSMNENLQNVTLKLNDLKLNSEDLFPLFRAFLSQKESCDKKWHSIHLDSNGIDREDLLTLTSLLKKFPNLEALSFSHNFDLTNEENKNIGDALVKLLSIPSLKNLSIVGDNEHQLGHELIQFLQSKNNNLEKIDISGNKISDSGLAETIKLIKRSEKLKSISFSNNGIKNKNALNDLLSALKNSKNFPTVKFPLFESVKQNDKNEKPNKSQKNEKNEKSDSSPDSLIEDQKQVEISEIFMRNRRKNGFAMELPFDYGDNFADEFVNELSSEFEKNFENDKRFTHSCVCMRIHLPLPFQRTTETTNGIRKQVDIGKMSIYQTDTMNYVVTEECPQGVQNDRVEEVKKKEKEKKKNDDESDKKKKKSEEEKKNKTSKNKDSDSEDDEKTKKKKKKNKNKNDDDESDSDEDEKTKKKKKTNKNKNDDDDDDEDEKTKKKKKTNKNKNDDSDEDEDEKKKRKKTKEKKRKNSDESDSYDDDDDDDDDDYDEKQTKKKKPKKISVTISSDDESDDKIDTSKIKYNLQTAVPKNSKRKQTKRGNIQSDSESESEYESEQNNRNRYNQNRNRKPVQRKNRIDSESDSFDRRNHRRNAYNYDDDDDQVIMNARKRKKNRYDDDDDIDDDQYVMNQRKRRNRYDDNDDDYDEPVMNQRKRKNYRYDDDDPDFLDDNEEDEDDMYSPRVKRRQPAPRFNNDDRNARYNARFKDQPVKKRIKESNPQLDGTFPDQYYRKKSVPITKI